MSHTKFAPMTSALFVRKGGAAPSIVPGQTGSHGVRALIDAAFDQHGDENSAESMKHVTSKPSCNASLPTRPKSPSERQQKRRLTLTLTQAEYETLGIGAAKKNVTRQQLVREALYSQLDALAHEFGGACECIIRD